MLGIRRIHSDVKALDSVTGKVFRNFQVWCAKAPSVLRDPSLAYALCLVVDNAGHQWLLRDVATKEEFSVNKSEVLSVNTNLEPLRVSELGTLPHTNPAAILDFLRQRFTSGCIYTTAHPLLVAINPFTDLGNATDEVIAEYRKAPDVDKLPPHVFTVARRAFETYHSARKSQTIIVSGESGAGKTEAAKHVMRFFAAGGVTAGHVQEVALAANPLLESFGNAKTVRNNNSSRFGRFMWMHLGRTGGILYGQLRNFLLEKSRVVQPSENERNFHIFYQLLSCPETTKKLQLQSLEAYNYLRSGSTTAAGIDDAKEWRLVRHALTYLQMSDREIDASLEVLAGILTLGNSEFVGRVADGIHDAATLANPEVFKSACNYLGLNPTATQQALLRRVTVAGGQTVDSPVKTRNAQVGRDSLAKALYERLFFFLVDRVNFVMGESHTESKQHFVGLLDIFGFEIFPNNSLEQLLINITNEKLQRNFTDAVFDRETSLYRQEGIDPGHIAWTSNEDLLRKLTDPAHSVMAALQDQCLAPSGSDKKFCNNAVSVATYVERPRINGDTSFVVKHSIGSITYDSHGFVDKNTDVLRGELVEVTQQSMNPVVAAAFAACPVVKGKLPKHQQIGAQFLEQLEELLLLINATEPHFVRCVKPNEEKKALTFVPDRVLQQLHSLSILEALELRQLGFSYRRPFEEFLTQFHFLASKVSGPTAKDRAQGLAAAACDKDEWRLGHTMIFLKRTGARKLELQQRQVLSEWMPLVEVLEACAQKMKYRKEYESVHEGLRRVQALCRKEVLELAPSPHFKDRVAGWD